MVGGLNGPDVAKVSRVCLHHNAFGDGSLLAMSAKNLTRDADAVSTTTLNPTDARGRILAARSDLAGVTNQHLSFSSWACVDLGLAEGSLEGDTFRISFDVWGVNWGGRAPFVDVKYEPPVKDPHSSNRDKSVLGFEYMKTSNDTSEFRAQPVF